jgi:hypothetical protein
MPRIKTATILFFVSFFILLGLTSCQQKAVPFMGPGRLLLLRTMEGKTAIYELRTGDTEPRILFDNLPGEQNGFIVSPDGKWMVLGKYLFNLESGEYEALSVYLYSGEPINFAFSPDGKSLAYVRDSVLVLNLETMEENFLVNPACRNYTCGTACLEMIAPFWVDNDVLLFRHDVGVFEPNMNTFPSTIGKCTTLGSPTAMSVIDLRENSLITIIPESEGGALLNPPNEYHYWEFQENYGPTIITNTFALDEGKYGFSYGLVWLETAKLKQGVFDPHYLGDYTNDHNYFLSPDGKFLLRWDGSMWIYEELRTGEIISLGKSPKPENYLVAGCEWLDENDHIVCNNREMLFSLSTKGESFQVFQYWEENDNYMSLLRWVPSED